MQGWNELSDILGSAPTKSKPDPCGSFEPPPTTPLDMPILATIPDADVWGFLQFDYPIEDPGMLAFQVASITVGLAVLKRKLEALERLVENGPRE